MNILVDNTVLSNLAVVRRPELLRAAFGHLLATSQEVFEELDAGVLRGKFLHSIGAGYPSGLWAKPR